MNKEKRFTLDDTKAKRFRRWKGSNPGLELEAFRAFLASATNADLSTEEKRRCGRNTKMKYKKHAKMKSRTPS
jgi:hypothetical protein